MAAAPKKAKPINPRVLADLHARTKVLGKQFDMPALTLAKGGFVTGATSFGALGIDLVTGGGAAPGRFANVYGPSGSGKSTLMYMATANANAAGIPVLYFDHEASADAKYLTALGVNFAEAKGDDDSLFIYMQPSGGESTYGYIHQLIDGFPDMNTTSVQPPQAVVVIDSLAAMVPEDEEENAGDKDKSSSMAGTAKVHSYGLRLIKSKLARKNVTLLATNQLRLKPGPAYGNPEYEPGGQAIFYYSDLKIQVRHKGKPILERGRNMRGTRIEVTKNKNFPPFLKVADASDDPLLNIAFGYGFDRFYDGVAYLTMTGQIERVKRTWKIKGMEGHRLHGAEMQNDDLVTELFKNDFRDACYKQMQTGVAFERLFSTLKYDEMYKYDPESPGSIRTEAELAETVNQMADAHTPAYGVGAVDLAAKFNEGA